jgi:hypothetical protein
VTRPSPHSNHFILEALVVIWYPFAQTLFHVGDIEAPSLDLGRSPGYPRCACLLAPGGSPKDGVCRSQSWRVSARPNTFLGKLATHVAAEAFKRYLKSGAGHASAREKAAVG